MGGLRGGAAGGGNAQRGLAAGFAGRLVICDQLEELGHPDGADGGPVDVAYRESRLRVRRADGAAAGVGHAEGGARLDHARDVLRAEGEEKGGGGAGVERM